MHEILGLYSTSVCALFHFRRVSNQALGIPVRELPFGPHLFRSQHISCQFDLAGFLTKFSCASLAYGSLSLDFFFNFSQNNFNGMAFAMFGNNASDTMGRRSVLPFNAGSTVAARTSPLSCNQS